MICARRLHWMRSIRGFTPPSPGAGRTREPRRDGHAGGHPSGHSADVMMRRACRESDMAEREAIDPTACPAWSTLRHQAHRMRDESIRSLLNSDREFLRINAAGMSFDFSRQRLDSAVLDSLIDLAEQTGVRHAIDAMFAGTRINSTEGRAALHVALRGRPGDSFSVDGENVSDAVENVVRRMEAFADSVRSGAHRGATGERITDVVNIGIGGSDLGPAMAYQALRAYRDANITCHFVSNVDPTDIIDVLSHVTPEKTLFIIASKTFTTAETMINAEHARTWIVDHLGDSAVGAHFRRSQHRRAAR